MKRRNLLTSLPAAVAGGVLAPSISKADEGLLQAEGFHILDSDVGSIYMNGVWKTWIWKEHLQIKCPFPTGSKEWLIRGDGLRGTAAASGKEGSARYHSYAGIQEAILPRFDTTDLGDRVAEVYDRHAASFRLDEPDEEYPYPWQRAPWKILWLEFVCPDGAEHVLAVLPKFWDANANLTIFVKQPIDGEWEKP